MKLTIITISYNNADGLKRTIDSIINQTNKEFEFIVIDGGSSDGTKELLKFYKKDIDYCVSEPDKGIYNAMNKGIKAAKGEYVTFVNSGDKLYNTTAIERSLPYLEGADIITGKLNVVDVLKNNFEFVIENPDTLQFRTLYEGTILHPSSFIRKNCFNTVGLYDENLKIVSDWKWFLIALAKYGLTYKTFPEVVSTFYMDGVSEQKENQQKINNERAETLKHEFPLLIDDYNELLAYRSKSEILEKVRNSKWTKIGLTLGLMSHKKFDPS